jgi:DtxR family Mn-dependent transcriptional regulator
MLQKRPQNLSASLEDYLEAIFNIAGESKVTRCKDIAKSLKVARSSVTGALRLLAKRGLVDYEPYGFVTLTSSGATEAARVARKHNIIKSFFVNILGVKADVAGRAACKAEHALGLEVISKLLCYIEFATHEDKNGHNLAGEFKQFCETRFQNPEFKEGINRMNEEIALSEVVPGQKARIVKIIGRGGVNRRIADMGVVPGTIVEVERVAPLGDPMDVKLKGYRLSLRKEEAANIRVNLEE